MRYSTASPTLITSKPAPTTHITLYILVMIVKSNTPTKTSKNNTLKNKSTPLITNSNTAQIETHKRAILTTSLSSDLQKQSDHIDRLLVTEHSEINNNTTHLHETTKIETHHNNIKHKLKIQIKKTKHINQTHTTIGMSISELLCASAVKPVKAMGRVVSSGRPAAHQPSEQKRPGLYFMSRRLARADPRSWRGRGVERGGLVAGAVAERPRDQSRAGRRPRQSRHSLSQSALVVPLEEAGVRPRPQTLTFVDDRGGVWPLTLQLRRLPAKARLA